jgi:hypothetical protein
MIIFFIDLIKLEYIWHLRKVGIAFVGSKYNKGLVERDELERIPYPWFWVSTTWPQGHRYDADRKGLRSTEKRRKSAPLLRFSSLYVYLSASHSTGESPVSCPNSQHSEDGTRTTRSWSKSMSSLTDEGSSLEYLSIKHAGGSAM